MPTKDEWLAANFSDDDAPTDIVQESAKKPIMGSLRDKNGGVQVNVRFDDDEVAKLSKICEQKLDPRMESRAHFIRHWVTFGILETFRLGRNDFYLHTYEADVAARQAEERLKTIARHNEVADKLIATHQKMFSEPIAQREMMQDVANMYRTSELESVKAKLLSAFPQLGG